MRSLLIWSFKDAKQRKEGTCPKSQGKAVANSRLASVRGFPVQRPIHLHATTWEVTHMLWFCELNLVCKESTIL